MFLPGESHGQRRLAGYNPWDHKVLDMSEQLTLSLFRYLKLYSSLVGKQLTLEQHRFSPLENPCITCIWLTISLVNQYPWFYTCGFSQPQIVVLRYSLLKTSAYKWTQAVRIHVVIRLTVQCALLIIHLSK